MLTQTMALFIDSYRELSAKKIFWLTMGISGLIVLAIAAVGFSDNGNMTLLWFETSLPLAEMGISKDVFYKMVFVQLGFRFWLAWGATILALASTAGVFPDFLTGGAIDLALSKPIGRVRLLLTKYLASLLFVALQVAVFSLCAFLVIGIRGGSWEFSVFYAIPIVTLFFSYLYSVCALCGIITRSAMTSLIVTGLFWFLVFLIGSTEGVLLSFRTNYEVRVHSYETSIRQLENYRPAGTDENDNALEIAKKYNDDTVAAKRLEGARANLANAQADAEGITLYHRVAFAVKTLLPKTDETIGLLERRLISESDMNTMLAGGQSQQNVQISLDDDGDIDSDMRRAQQNLTQAELQSTLRNRSVWWIAGTSVLFEIAVLSFAAWRFNRRDF